jgi:hypothetical protein
VLNSRQKFFEIDTRFGQLGPKGIFETLDLAGVLHHRVSGVDNIEHAMKEPPAVGRARIRGQVIKRLAGGNAQCDWQSIVDYGGGQVLDLSDPFASEESWSSMSRQESIDEQLDLGLINSNDPDSRRQNAADRILSGDYAGAEELLIGLLAEEFMLPSTRCHMARVLLMTNREAEAREQIRQAWAIRADASNYVVPRILFFQCIFAIFDRAEITPIVRQIREALSASSAHLDWTIRPMIDPLRQRLGEANYLFLKALSEALSDERALPGLEEFVEWRCAATDLIEVAAT